MFITNMENNDDDDDIIKKPFSSCISIPENVPSTTGHNDETCT